MSNNWWSTKLGGTPSNTPLPPTAPTPPSTYTYQPNQNVPVNYDPNKDQVVTKAQSQNLTTRCPNCYSGNYMKVGIQSTQSGSFDVMRCYDCGYPKVQSGSGAGMPSGSSSGSATPAKQPAKGSGFNPNVIVDRIG